jgi:hypothetical protein
VTPADHDRIVEMLLGDPPLSCRAISRATGYSDWTIRKIARELDGDPRPMKRRSSGWPEPAEEVSALTSWLIFGGIVAAFWLAIWAGVRGAPRLDPRHFSTGSQSDSSPERNDNETEFPE